MIRILETTPLLLLFLVIALGYWVGRIRFWGSSMGVAAVLFVGLAFGALDPNLFHSADHFGYRIGAFCLHHWPGKRPRLFQ
ncbi:MAG: hypothetical protein M5U34_38535 [Chloroflexi bacterium]|nr:hypothetical protein [Chloroflexota bacterium]